jgi:molybdopterin converting factor small subunit
LAVDIEVFAQLLPGQPRRRALEIKGPATVRELARMIGLEESEIGMVAIDGVQSSLDDPVQPDSRICFFPYLSGG